MKYIYHLTPLALILLIWISFLYKDSKPSVDSNKNESGFARGSVDSNSVNRKSKARDRSLFEEDSKFLEFPEVGIEEPDSVPMTAAEKESRRKLIIEKSKKLAALFPHNSVIPREFSIEEAKKKAEITQKMTFVQNQFMENEKVSKEDRLFYYKERLKTSKDRLEIFRYALGLQNAGTFDESKLDGFLKERYEIFIENENAYKEEIIKVEKEN